MCQGQGSSSVFSREKTLQEFGRKSQASISVDEEEEEILFHREVRVKQIEIEV